MIKTWADLKFWSSPQADKLTHMLEQEEKKGVVVYPRKSLRLLTFDTTPFDKVKCVILGQDPYHSLGLAHGLAFSVQQGGLKPPSLNNILKEYSDDLGYPRPTHGSLYSWACNGVLLLNTALTVREGQPNSHKNWGWEKLTHEVVQGLSEQKERPIAFCLWGRNAQEYRGLINEERHLVICSSHPSPYSVEQGFRGHQPFTRVNKFLTKDPVNWRL